VFSGHGTPPSARHFLAARRSPLDARRVPPLPPRALPCLAACIFVALFGVTTDLAAQDCVHDDALARAALNLTLAGHTPSSREVLEAARTEGSDAPTIHALATRGADGATRAAEWLLRMSGDEHLPLSCAHADSETGTLWLAAPRLGSIAIVSEDPLRVRASFVVSTGAATLFVLDAHGETSAYEVPGSPTEIELPSDLVAPLSLQLVASRPEGPRPVAERMVGSAPVDVALSEGTSLEAAIGMLRDQAEVAPLRTSHLLDELAETHAEAVCREGRVAHVLDAGDAEDRLARAGVIARHVGEVVARGRDEAAAWHALATSPSHRGALLDRRFTDAGVGRASDDEGRHCVVVLLAAWPRRVR
jgi:uncharacterized protein YkwD